MDALERLRRIGTSPPAETWDGARLLQAAREGKGRWAELEELFGTQWPLFADGVAAVAPAFQLLVEEEAAARATRIREGRNVNSRVAVWFLKWERCPATSGLPNPYEPWIEIWEHGGHFGVEHGQFVDVYDTQGMPLGCVFVRRA